jgi:hypothetical protein
MNEWIDSLIAGLSSLLVTCFVAMGIKERIDKLEAGTMTEDTCKAVRSDFGNRIDALQRLVERMDREEAEWRKLVAAKLDRLIER